MPMLQNHSKFMNKSDLFVFLLTGFISFAEIKLFEFRFNTEFGSMGETIVLFVTMVFLYGIISMYERAKEFSSPRRKSAP